MKEMEKEICGACVNKLKSEGYKVECRERSVDQKVTCELCGRRNYGGKYEVEKGKRSERAGGNKGIH